MGNIKDIQISAKSLREENTRLNQQLSASKAKLEKVEAQIKRLQKSGIGLSDHRASNLIEGRQLLVKNRETLAKEFLDNKTLLNALDFNIKEDYNPEKDIEQLDDSYPILLFPLRLETRFKKSGRQNELWVRVYPDDSNVIKNEPNLTEDELANAKNFWAEMAKAGKTELEERGAWHVIAKNHGNNRAAWIIEQYKPLNEIVVKDEASHKVLVLIDENENPIDLKQEAITYWKEVWQAQGDNAKIEIASLKLKAVLTTDEVDYFTNLFPYNLTDVLEEEASTDKIVISKINLPNSDLIVTTRTSWNEATRTNALPDKFVAITYSNGNKKTHIFENSVKNNLAVGLDPSLENEEIKKDLDGIHLNEELKWMVDFDEAVKAGMALKISLSSEEENNGFDQLFVIGMRASSDAQTSLIELENLITSQKNSKQGFSFIKQGTPTNNTEDSPSGYSWTEDADESYDRIFKGSENFNITSDIKTQSDAQRFAESLNLNPAIFQGMPNANGKDQSESIAMNTALFPSTMGYFMEEMMDPLFNQEDIEATRKIFTNSVSGRGPIPAIQIGRQPYGILPVTTFSNLSFSKAAFFENKLKSLINEIDKTWDSKVSDVSYIGKDGDPHQILLDVLGLHSNSVEFYQRYAQSIKQVVSQLRLSTKNPFIAGRIAAAISNRGKSILKELGLNPDLKLPILEKYFLSKPNKLSGPLIDDVPESEIEAIRGYTGDNKNYIEWLQSADGNRIRLQNFDGNPIPNALLYLLLRHSVLLSQANAGTNLLFNKGLIQSKKVFHDPVFLHIQEKETSRSKFEHLYQPNNQITSDTSTKLIDYIYKRDILSQKDETKVLNEVLQALKILEKTPTARLERLLIEHLDCCTYRIDSWKTGLTYEQLKLQQQQLESQQKEKGIFLGAYGWLLDLRPKGDILEEIQLSQQDSDFFAPKGETVFLDNTNLGYIHAPSIDQASTAAILRNAYDSNKESGVKNPFAINLTSERVRMANDFLEGIRNGQSLSALLGYQFERGLHDRYQTSNIEADKFIYTLRMEFPLVTNNLENTQTSDDDIIEANETNNVTDTSIEAIEARNVIDGLKLIQFVQNSSTKTYPFGKSNLLGANADEKNAITEEVNRIIEINDAIADLLMAEQVYQAVKGNFDRAAGAANAFSNGAYPPEIEVINTPRTGLILNHKLAIHFDADADATISPNAVGSMTPKAKVEAAVNKWLSDTLPSPKNVQVKVKIKEPNIPEISVFVSQMDLGLQSIDLLFSATLDNEQAMAEIDDRIINFLLYKYKDSLGNSLNPFSEIGILYTEEIDSNDKSKVSFFELGSTLNSLRKILVNRPYVNHLSLQLTTESSNKNDIVYDIDDFTNRIDELKSDLNTKHIELKAFINNVVSVQSLLQKNEEKLKLESITENVIEILNQYLRDSLKNYSLNKTDALKTELIDQFKALLDSNSIIDPLKVILIADFKTFLDEYVTDFSNISILIKDTCNKFMAIALFDNNLTGTGFIHQAVGGIFKRVVANVKVVIERWDSKESEFDLLMSDYIGANTDEEKIQILQKAERKISSQGTYPVPLDINNYKTIVDNKYTNFEKVLSDLKNTSIINHLDVFTFLTSTNTVLIKIADHDVVSYDAKNNRNDTYEEFKNLIQLKEDIYTANFNLVTHIQKKLKSYDVLIDPLDALNTSDEKIQLLLKAAKTILKEDILLLPKLNLSPDFGSAIKKAFDGHQDIQKFSKDEEERLFPIDDWFAGIARVRENAWYFENSLSLMSGFKPENSIELKPLQIPFRENARWLAMKFIKKDEDFDKYIESLEGDSLLYTAHFATDFDQINPISGIVIDEWTEVIPFKNETTGIAFHYDQPNSEPPQTMLLLTPSHISGSWGWEDVIGALVETLAMAKKRAVEPSMIDNTKFGQFLPTTLMAVSTHWISVAMNLSLNNLPLLKEE